MEFSPAVTHQKPLLSVYRTWWWGVSDCLVSKLKNGKGFW
jgi:hypothetical protein